MEVKLEHPWDMKPDEAEKLQRELREIVKEEQLKSEPKFIAGFDVSYSQGSNKLYAGVIVFSYPDFEIVEKKVTTKEVKFPYIPGFLSFRETPALIEVAKDIEAEPDLIFLDGQGIAHPRFFGIASHVGVIFDKPSIGVAKRILVGEAKPGSSRFMKKGDRIPIIFQGRKVGYLLITREGENPVVVSVGHKITLEEACSWTLRCCLGFRIPEPTRIAHFLVNEYRKRNP